MFSNNKQWDAFLNTHLFNTYFILVEITYFKYFYIIHLKNKKEEKNHLKYAASVDVKMMW